MNVMLEFYRRTWGESATYHGNGSNGPCPFCGDTSTGSHRSDRFVIWTEKTEGLGKTCSENGISGVCWCRQCGKGGDSIFYLMEAEGLSFEESCDALGIAKKPADYSRKSRRAPDEKPKSRAFEGRATATPGEIWQEHAARMDAEARKALPGCASAMRWLHDKHGITAHMANRYGLGFLAGENGKNVRFRRYSSFGLPPKQKADGSFGQCIGIQRGITIVSRDEHGLISMFRIRRPNGDVATDRHPMGKFYELPGGSKCSYHLRPSIDQAVTVYVVVEGEMDAMLLHAVAGESIGCVAMRNCSNKPDEETHRALAKADLILVALDSDAAGQSGSEWWMRTYPHARPYPVPGFKDPGDAFEAGFDLRLWLESGMPRSVRLAPSTCESTAAPVTPKPAPEVPSGIPAYDFKPLLEPIEGAVRPKGFVEPCAEGDSFGGAGEQYADGSVRMDAGHDNEFPPFDPDAYDDAFARDNAVAMYSAPSMNESQGAYGIDADDNTDKDVLTPSVMRGLVAVLPSFFDIETMSRDVLTLAVMWRGVPVHYRRNGGGYSWDVQPDFRKRNPDLYDRFIRLATSSPDIADWLSIHTSDDVWSGNFLDPFGGKQ